MNTPDANNAGQYSDEEIEKLYQQQSKAWGDFNDLLANDKYWSPPQTTTETKTIIQHLINQTSCQ